MKKAIYKLSKSLEKTIEHVEDVENKAFWDGLEYSYDLEDVRYLLQDAKDILEEILLNG